MSRLVRAPTPGRGDATRGTMVLEDGAAETNQRFTIAGIR